MVAEIAGIVAGAVDEGGLTAAEELHSHEIQAGLIDEAGRMCPVGGVEGNACLAEQGHGAAATGHGTDSTGSVSP